ncbi:hypothetical protein D9M72_314420 [compost metagenome]
MLVPSDTTIIAPVPSRERRCRTDSKSSATSRSRLVSSVLEGPPVKTALNSLPWSIPPPCRNTSVSRLVPIGSSYRPGRKTSPESEYSLVPAAWPMPRPRYHWAPLRKMPGTWASVSVLLTTVGAPCTPCSAGKGGLRRGNGNPPSTLAMTAVSSPPIYKPELGRTRSDTGPPTSPASSANCGCACHCCTASRVRASDSG